MSSTQNEVIEYPESDGQPMGETDLHIYWLLRLRDLLQTHYKGQHVYVGTDLLVYYEAGNPKKFVVPDVFIVLDCKPDFRRTFKIWEEGRAPDVVIEITSRSTADKDLIDKRQLYAALGVQEYFLFDPEADYLTPPLRGFHLHNGRYIEMEELRLTSEVCQCTLTLEDNFLNFIDLKTSQPWLTEAEIAQRELESYQRQLESADAENARLRAEIERLKRR